MSKASSQIRARPIRGRFCGIRTCSAENGPAFTHPEENPMSRTNRPLAVSTAAALCLALPLPCESSAERMLAATSSCAPPLMPWPVALASSAASALELSW